MHKARKYGIGEEHLPSSGICFEPLEPRLLLSGSWGDGVDSSIAGNQTHPKDSSPQKTVSLASDADVTAPHARHVHQHPAAERIDLLTQAPVLISTETVESTLDGTLSSNQISSDPLAVNETAPNETNNVVSNPEMQKDIRAADEMYELVLVNEDVADYQTLIDALQSNNADRNFEVVVLDAHRDGVTQVSEILGNRSDLSAVHVITHGSEGQINIGNTYLNRTALSTYSGAISGWGNALTETGDILFYGCNIAADSDGQAMLNDMAILTGADVAASLDPTGNQFNGGDWQLEYAKGSIETDISMRPQTLTAWSHLLAAPTITSNGGGPTATINVVENTTTVTTVSASDIDGDTPTFSISGGADSTLFDIDTNSGLLTFQTAPDFENRTDDDNNGIYEVTVMADDGNGGTDTQDISVTVTNADNALWISTDGDAVPPGANGLPGGWTQGEVLDFGNPGLTLGPATSGNFSSVINFDNFTVDATDPGALHFVARDVTVGSGANQFNLQIGDILLSFNQEEEILAAYSESGTQTTVHENDLLAFRPDNPGDYTSGIFYTVLNGVPDPDGNPINSLHAISLVEQDTYVAGTLLTEGSFIFSEQLGTLPNTPNHIYHFTPTDAGTAAAAGTCRILIDGDDINIEDGKNIRGLELIEKSTTIGGLTLDAGDILVTLKDDDASTGDNSLNTATQDIFVLKVTQAEPEAGNLTAATAEMVLDGSLVGLDGAERIYAITSVPDNYGPAIGGDVTGTVTEDVGVVAGNITESGTLTIADPNAGESSFVPETLVGSYGSLSIDAAGAWTYTADNSQVAIQNLNAGDDLTDIYRVTSADGTTQSITITIDGAGEAPIARPDGVNLSFDGDDFIRIVDAPSLQMTNNVTMEAWINHSGLGTGSQIILNKEGEYEMGITADTGEIIYAIAPSVSPWSWHSTGHIITPGEWTHVAITFDGGAGEINTFINGVKVDTFAQPGPMGDVYPMYDDLYIGGRENAVTQRFQGQIDDVRIWNTTRTQGEIQSNMNGLLTGAETGLAGYWRLDEAGTGTVVDQSGAGNNGTLGGAEGTSATPAYQGYVTDEDTPLVIPAVSGVLANDADPNGDAMTVTHLDTTGMLGNLVLNTSDGSFTYDPNGAFESLNPGEHAIETFTYSANDGTSDSNTVTATITVVGTNESPVAVADSFTADEGSTTNLDLAGNDSDADDGLDLTTIAIVSGPAYGSIFVNNDGTVDYTHDGSETTADSFTYTIDDSSTATSNTVTVTLTIAPINDIPIIGGTNTGGASEDLDADTDGQIETGGNLTIADPDTGESSFQAGTVAGTYGHLTIDAAGNWTYAADNTQAAIQQLDQGESIIDTMTVTTADGTTVNVIITINGNEDMPSIAGTHTGTVLKDAALSAGGTLAITDVDASDNPVVFNNAPGVLGDNGYGTFTITAGNWTYTLNNAHAAVQAMAPGEAFTDSHTFTASDGSTQVVTVTIGSAPIVNDNTPPLKDQGDDTDSVEDQPEPEQIPVEDLPVDDSLLQPEESIVPMVGSTKVPGNTSLQMIAPTHFVPTISMTTTDDAAHDRGASPSLAGRVLNFFRHQLRPPISENLATDHSAFFSGDIMTEELDRIERQIAENLSPDVKKGQMIIGAAAGMGASVFVGYVIWAFRGASLLLGALTAMPMWRCFDPLPVLSGKYLSREENAKKKIKPTLEDDEKKIGELLGEKQNVYPINGSFGGNK